MSFFSKLLRAVRGDVGPRGLIAREQPTSEDPTPPSAPEAVPGVSTPYARSAYVFTESPIINISSFNPHPSAPLPEPPPAPKTFTKPLCGQETKRSILL